MQVWNTTATVDIPKWLGFFEKLLKKSGTGYFVGNKVSPKIKIKIKIKYKK
jgi:hypothetical protein